jgi:hypothetical protein
VGDVLAVQAGNVLAVQVGDVLAVQVGDVIAERISLPLHAAPSKLARRGEGGIQRYRGGYSVGS